MKKTYAIVALVLLLSAPASARLHSHYNMGPAHRFAPAVGERVNFVSFSNGWVIDTRQGEPNLPARFQIDESFSDRLYYIIQFSGPIDQRWFKELKQAGISAFGYLPHYAVLAKMDAGQREFAASLPMVRWTGIFQPAYKLEAELLRALGLKDINILLMPDEEASAVTNLVNQLGGAVKQVMTTAFGTTIDASLDASRLADLCRLNQVLWVQEWTEPTLCNNHCQWVTQTGWQETAPADTDMVARRIWQKGVRGQGVILSITDTGLNTGHDMFRDPAMPVSPPGIWPDHRKVVASKLYQGASVGEQSYHGSHVNCTVAGNDSVTGGTSYYDGMAPDARLYFMDLTNASGSFVIPTDFTSVWDTVYLGRGLPDSLRPVVQHSGSWGWSSSTGAYKIQDASTDAYCWEHKDFLCIMAAGNEQYAKRLRNPGIAKNVLTVGASKNGIQADEIANFSSRGPTQDNRIKPNVMAPGVALWSAKASPATNTYQSMSGTSMATPAVNGTVGLMRCYLQEGYYPTGAADPGDRLPYNTSALLRSMALASADPNVDSYTVPSFDIGWGRIDADSVLFFADDTADQRGLLLCDDTFGLATGEYKETQFQVDSQIPLRVCLAWTDTSALPSANPTLINDLNLELTSPGGTKYRGNQYASGESEPDPVVWDSINVEECCRVEMPDTGLWTIKVYGQNVRTAENQWFAWAITGGLEPVLPPPKDVGVTAILVPADSVYLDSTVTPSAVVENFGTDPETFLVSFLIGSAYSDTQTVMLAAGTVDTLEFEGWQADSLGTFAAMAFTALAGDTNPANDTLADSVAVVPGTGVKEEGNLPKVFNLGSPVPNPFTGRSTIRFSLPRATRVDLVVYSVAGTLVRTVTSDQLPAGYHQAVWNARDDDGRACGAGVYLVRFEAGDYTATRKLVLDR